MSIFLIALFLIAVVVIAILVVMLIRALSFGKHSKSTSLNTETKDVELDSQKIAEHLSQVIQCETLSNPDPDNVDNVPFEKLHQVLEENYPLIKEKLEKTVHNGYNLIYRWEGSNTELDPILFMAHQDVVPADPATLDQWTHPPFSGAIVDGVIWGRGSLDCKTQLNSIMEAIEALLAIDYQPERTLYIAFGQDEEVGGDIGQKEISQHFKDKGVHFAAVVDEGSGILPSVLPGVKAPVALIGNTEKGYLTLEIKATGSGGHSSMPSKVTTIGRLARGIAALENNPVPGTPKRIVPTIEHLGKFSPFIYKLGFSNLWLFNGMLTNMLTADPKTAAVIRTTTAVTIVSGGVKDNILPSEATAIVNMRLAPGDSIASIIEYVKYLVQPYALEVSVSGKQPWEAAIVSDPDSPAYDHLEDCIRKQFGDVAIAPFIMTGATDAHFYSELSENVFRFCPVHMEEGQLESVHNINEYITIDQLTTSVKFMAELIQRWGQAQWVAY